MLSQIAALSSFLRLNNTPLHECTTFGLLFHWLIVTVLLPCLAIANDVAVNTGAQVPL